MNIRASLAGLVVLGLGIEAGFYHLRSSRDLATDIVAAIATLLTTSIVYLIAVYLILKLPSSAWVCGIILAFSLAYRITVWNLYPTLSDDIYRYRWSGMLQAKGGNPYQSRPVDPAWAQLHDATWKSLTGRDFRTIYGPLVLLYERWTYKFTAWITSDPAGQVFWFKAPSALCDLGVIGLLLLLLRARGQPLERVLVYAWSPLPIVEFWVNGHNDSLVVLLILMACLAAASGASQDRLAGSREELQGIRLLFAASDRFRSVARSVPRIFSRRLTRAVRKPSHIAGGALIGAALGLAAAAKIWPIILLPLLGGRDGGRSRRVWQLLLALIVPVLLFLPYASNVLDNARHLSGYLGGWRNNDSLYGGLLWLTGDVYRAKYLALGLVCILVVVVAVRRLTPEPGVLSVVVGMLLISANCHPWYLTWVLPFLAFYPEPALLLWTVLAPLSYEVLIGWKTLGIWEGSTPMRWWIYLPVLFLAIVRWGRRKPAA